VESSFHLSNQIKLAAILIVLLLLLGSIPLLAFQATRRVVEDRQSMAHTYEVLAELQEATVLINDAEDRQRGFVITGDETLLEAFEEDLRRFDPIIVKLRNLIQDNPTQLMRLERVVAETRAKFSEMRDVIHARQEIGPHAARDLMVAKSSNKLMERIRTMIDEMIDQEKDLLEQRRQTARISGQRAMLVFSLLVVLFLGALAIVLGLVYRGLQDQARAAAELRKSREQYELAVRGSNDGIWDWDLESNAVYYSPRWKSQLGFEDHEISNRFEEFEDRLHPMDHDRVMNTVRDYLEGRLAIYAVEFRMRCKDGQYRWILARGVALRDSSGKPFRMAGSHTDITERKEYESVLASKNELLERAMETERQTNEALRDAQVLMVQSEKMAGLGNMVAGVAHEINNPLAFVTNNIAVLQRDFAEVCQLLRMYAEADELIAHQRPELHARIAQFRAQVEIAETLTSLPDLFARTADGLRRIRQIVGDLRLFARLDEGEVNDADLNAGIRSTVTIVQGTARDRDVRIQLELEPLPAVTCHAARINQVIMNLLSNAIDACERGGLVTVRTRADGKHVLVEVIDNGKGIHPSIRDRIFDPFFTTKPIGKGTGLGLSISYRIIQDHNGTIEVESAAGKGSRFTIRLPIHPACSPAERSSEAERGARERLSASSALIRPMA
jgi:PAS domain S-box-containing protein